MKVFACKRSTDYSGGVAIVAANNAEEAFTVLHQDIDREWMLDIEDMETGEYTSDINRRDSYYYKRKDWFEMTELTANVDKPQVIIEDGYTE